MDSQDREGLSQCFNLGRLTVVVVGPEGYWRYGLVVSIVVFAAFEVSSCRRGISWRHGVLDFFERARARLGQSSACLPGGGALRLGVEIRVVGRSEHGRVALALGSSD